MRCDVGELVEVAIRSFQLFLSTLDLLEHFVKPVVQHADLVVAGLEHPYGVVGMVRDLSRLGGQREDRTRDQSLEPKGHDDREYDQANEQQSHIDEVGAAANVERSRRGLHVDGAVPPPFEHHRSKDMYLAVSDL